MADSTRRIFVNRRNSSPNLNVAESSNSIFQISVSNSSIHGNASPSSVVIVERGGIVQTETFDSSSAEEDNGLLTIRKSHSVESDVDDHYEAEMGAADKLERGINNNSNNKTMIHPAAISIQKSIIPTTPKNLEAMDCSHFGSWAELSWYFYFISTFAILGTVLRVYMGRFFGLDCLLKEHDLSSNTSRDFLTPISSLLCITSDGRLQRGGAIFIDLPANILGCFFMGLISPASGSHRLLWLRSDRPMQWHIALHVGLQVGFCGCLTTFSSWNNQMIVMMDGTGTDLGPQVGTAIFGYFIGVACAVSGFLLGRQACEWISDHYCRLPHLGEGGQTVVESLDHADGHAKADSWLKLVSRSLVGTITDVNYWPFVLVVGLLAAFIYGGTGNGSQAYRHMWISMLLTPGGALLRWRISELNVRKQWMVRRGWGWFPLGTLIANLVAAIICAFVEALTARYLADGETNAGWILPCLHAVVIGFSGSLSTVSTLVREMFALDSVGQAHCYCFITIVSSMLISLLIYSPMVRTD